MSEPSRELVEAIKAMTRARLAVETAMKKQREAEAVVWAFTPRPFEEYSAADDLARAELAAEQKGDAS